MNHTIQIHEKNGIAIAEVLSDEILILKTGDGLDLMGDLYFQGYGSIIIHEKNITPEFFDLKNGMAGEILQKFSNYRVRLSIVGDFSACTGKSIRDFIYESNKLGHVTFVGSVEEAKDILVNLGS